MSELIHLMFDFATTRPEFIALAALLALLVVISTAALGALKRRRRLKRRLRVEMPAQKRELATDDPGEDPLSTLGLDQSGGQLPPALERFISQADNILNSGNAGKIKLARQRMIRAGLFSPRAVVIFFLSRIAGALGLPIAVFLALAAAEFEPASTTLLLMLLIAAIAGYLGPSIYIDKRAKAVLRQNRIAFPDFMDLMGVCANAGLSMEAGLERVTQELAPMYPALGVNLQVLCLEVRAGRPMELALQTLADRVGVPEVRAFATLLQQSRELGSSLSDALRVFAEDMRHQRLAAAEEKAYALPAKLSVPVTACILPVVLFIAIWPVVVKFNS